MLNKELLLMGGGKGAQFPPDLSELLTPDYIIVALTINKGTSIFDVDYISMPFSMLDADGNNLNGALNLGFHLDPDLGYYVAKVPIVFDRFNESHAQPQMIVGLPNENAVFATYNFEDAYVQPSEDTSSVGWRFAYKRFSTVNRKLTVQIESSHSPRPPTIGLVIDLTV